MKSYEAMEEEALAVRRDIIEMLYQAGSGHPGGSLSVTDILVCLYNLIRVDAAGTGWYSVRDMQPPRCMPCSLNTVFFQKKHLNV